MKVILLDLIEQFRKFFYEEYLFWKIFIIKFILYLQLYNFIIILITRQF